MKLVTPDLNPLVGNEVAIFNLFKSVLEEKEREGKVLFLFRGELYSNLQLRLTMSTKKVTDSEIFGRVFVIGEKARQYSEGIVSSEKTYLSTINDVSTQTLNFIFNRTCNVVTSRRLRQRVEKKIPINFKDYFIDPGNRSHFIESISSFDYDLKLKLRDYYLYLLHTSGNDGINNETFFVSTSTKKRIAKFFSWNRKALKRLVFHYYIPSPFNLHAIAPWMLENQHEIVSSIALPTYNPTGLFSEQKEVSVKGALFPIFIIGMELIDDDLFVVNPNILRLNEEICQFSAHLGIPPSETSFESTIFDTAYSGSVTNYLNGIFDDERFKDS